jgi:hypothetical protein
MKLYVLVTNKISKKQQFVQGAHAAIEWARCNPEYHPVLVMLQVDDINLWCSKLSRKEHYVFRDSYYDNMVTAIASDDIGNMVEGLKLI